MSDRDIEELREEKKEELRKRVESQGEEEQTQHKQKQTEEAIKKQRLRQILTEDARKRIENVKMVDEERANKVEQVLLSQIPDPSQLSEKVGEEKVKDILKELKDDTSFNIRRK